MTCEEDLGNLPCPIAHQVFSVNTANEDLLFEFFNFDSRSFDNNCIECIKVVHYLDHYFFLCVMVYRQKERKRAGTLGA